jgi:hypothetical protein
MQVFVTLEICNPQIPTSPTNDFVSWAGSGSSPRGSMTSRTNPDEPPMPGKVTYEQAKRFARAFVSGQPRKATIATTLFNDKILEMLS